jgi:hypothetical protein
MMAPAYQRNSAPALRPRFEMLSLSRAASSKETKSYSKAHLGVQAVRVQKFTLAYCMQCIRAR